jgi:hypothetical protein
LLPDLRAVTAQTSPAQTRLPPAVVRLAIDGALPDEVTGGDSAWSTARLFVPERLPQDRRPSVLACLHGGSYDWRYFHITGQGLQGYSMAEHLAARGHIVIVPDQYGIGESARPANPVRAGRDIAAAANAAAMRVAFTRLAEGTLDPRIPACRDFVKVGIGHSLGAMVVLGDQAKFGTYDLVAPLGCTTHGPHLDIDGVVIRQAPLPLDQVPGYQNVDRERVFRSFHWEGLPPEVIAADEAMSGALPGDHGLGGRQSGQGSGRRGDPCSGLPCLWRARHVARLARGAGILQIEQ